MSTFTLAKSTICSRQHAPAFALPPILFTKSPLSESRESDASDDVLESRIVAERVETRIVFDPHHPGGALVDPLFKPFDRLLAWPRPACMMAIWTGGTYWPLNAPSTGAIPARRRPAFQRPPARAPEPRRREDRRARDARLAAIPQEPPPCDLVARRPVPTPGASGEIGVEF